MIVTVEDQSKLRLIKEQRLLIDKQIEEQIEKRARLECQSNLLKLQLINAMEQLEQRLKQAQGLENMSGDQMIFMDDNKIRNISTTQFTAAGRSGSITSPSKLSSYRSQTASTKTKSKASLRDKMDNIEINLLALKNNINHHESVSSNKIEKTVQKTQNEISFQMKVFKDALNKLSDVIVEEFDQVRLEFKNEIKNNSLTLNQRLEYTELNQTKMYQDTTKESLQIKSKIDQQYENILKFEENQRRDMERQKMTLQSLMTDSRLSQVQTREDFSSLSKQLLSLQTSNKMKDEILESLKNQQDLCYQKVNELERSLNDFNNENYDSVYNISLKLETAVKDLEHVRIQTIPRQDNTLRDLHSWFSSLEQQTLEKQDNLEQDFKQLSEQFKDSVSHLERLGKDSSIQTLKDLDRKLYNTQSQLQQQLELMHNQEQLVYDFRRDLVSNMNEIEKFFNKKNEQFAKAFTELSKELRVNNPLLFC